MHFDNLVTTRAPQAPPPNHRRSHDWASGHSRLVLLEGRTFRATTRTLGKVAAVSAAEPAAALAAVEPAASKGGRCLAHKITKF